MDFDNEDPLLLEAADLLTAAVLISDRRHHTEAESLYRHILQIQMEVLGDNHSMIAVSYFNLAKNLVAQSRLDEAEPLYEVAVTMSEATFGRQHQTAIAISGSYLGFLQQKTLRELASDLERDKKKAKDEAAEREAGGKW